MEPDSPTAQKEEISNESIKPVKMTESEVRLARIKDLRSMIKDYKTEQKQEEVKLSRLNFPLKRISSLPNIHQHIPLVRTLFPDSKSVNLGFEPPIPDIPNGTIIIDELPDQKLQDLKDMNANLPHTRGRLHFSIGIDNTDLDLLAEVENHDHRSFLKHRVGAKHFEEILTHIDTLGTDSVKINATSYGAFRRRLCLCFFIPPIIAFSILVALILQLPPPEKEPLIPTVPPNSTPTEYLPPAKILRVAGNLIYGDIFCDKSLLSTNVLPSPHSRFYETIMARYMNQIRSVMQTLGFPSGNSFATSITLVGDKVKLRGTIRVVANEACPILLWLGMNFETSADVIIDQLYVLASYVIFPEVQKRRRFQCSIDKSGLKGTYEAVARIGKMFQIFSEPQASPALPSSFRNIIKRKMNEE